MSNVTKLAPGGGAVHEARRSVTRVPARGLSAQSRKRRALWRTLARRALYVVVALVVSYVVTVNVLLRTRLLRRAVSGSDVRFAISGTSSDLRLDYASAYSLLPGVVHLEGLSLRGRDTAVEWFLTLDKADVRVSLLDLLRRTFHASRVRASGFTMRARLRLDRAAATREVVAALPPIAGFADPPLRAEGPGPPPLRDADYKLWTIHLEDVEVEHVREVWVHTVRSEGDTRVRGRWLFRPERWLDVGPATVDANGVDIFFGSHPLATGVVGSFGATVHPFDVRGPSGLALFENVSTRGQLGGRAIVEEAVRLLAPGSGVTLTRCEGRFDAQLIVDHGRLDEGTRARVDMTDCTIDAEGLKVEAPTRTELGVLGGLATVGLHVSELRASHLGVSQARVASVDALVTSRHLQIAHAFDDARFTLDVAGVETDLVAWTRYLPAAFIPILRSSIVKAHGHAEGSLPDAWAVGTATITSDSLEARLGPAVVAGSLAMHVDLRRATWEGRRLDLSGSDAVVRAVSARAGERGEPFLVVPSLTVVAPRLTVAPAGVDGQVSIDLPRADLVNLGTMSGALPLPAGLAIERGSGRAKLHAEVDLGDGSVRGDGELATRDVRALVGKTRLFGDVAVALQARRDSGAAGATDVSGSTLVVTNAGSGSGASPEDRWWGSSALRDATLRTAGGVHFDAKAHLTAKDASPATALVSQNTGVPTWAADIFRMPALDADARVVVAPSSLEVRGFVARGGGSTSVRAEYARRDGRQDGGVLLDLGWIDLGYDLAEGSTGLVILGPQAWYARKTATLRDAAAAARRRSDAAEQLARYTAMAPEPRRDQARALAAACARDVRSCDGAAVENLVRSAEGAAERDSLRGVAYAPIVVAAAKGGKDGSELDPRVVGSVAEALRIGGESTLDDLASIAPDAAASDPGAARGKVIIVTGRVAQIRREGRYSLGTMTTDAEPIVFVTPFATTVAPEARARFRGVFVQQYQPADAAPGRPSLVLVGAFREAGGEALVAP